MEFLIYQYENILLNEIDERVKGEEFILIKQKNNYSISPQYDEEQDQQQEFQLTNIQSKLVLSYYIKIASQLRDKYNHEKIHQQLKSICNQQIHSDIIETDEVNNIAKIGLYSINSLDEAHSGQDSIMNETFDQNKEIKFFIYNSQKIEELCKNVDHLIDSLLNMSIPDVDQYQFSSSVQNNSFDTPYVKPYSYIDDTSYDYYIRLMKPEILDKMLKEPVKIQMNMLHIIDDGFLKYPQFSMFNDVQNSFKVLNIQVEVKNLQISIYFKKKGQSSSNQMKQQFINLYTNYVKKNIIYTEWIYTKQILEVYLYFTDVQQKQITSLIHKQFSLRDQLMDISKYQVKIILNQQLNAAIVNDINIGLYNQQNDQFIKKVYYSSEVKSNEFKFLGSNNNISFIHTQQFADSKQIKYQKYKIQKKANLNHDHSQEIDSDSMSRSYDMDSYYDSSLSLHDYDSNFSEDGYLQKQGNQNTKEKNTVNQTQFNIFNIYRELLDHHFSQQAFIFSSSDVHSTHLSRIIAHFNYPLNINDLIHKKTSVILSILAFDNLVSHVIHYKPQKMIWDFYFL